MTPLEEVAGRVLDAVLADQFWINPEQRRTARRALRVDEGAPQSRLLPQLEPDDGSVRVSRSGVRALIGRRVGRHLGAVEVGERADAEPTVALGLGAHAIAPLRVVVRTGVVLARRRVARDEHPARSVPRFASL